MQGYTNKKVLGEILNKLEEKFPTISRQVQKKLVRSFYIKSVDKILEGKKVSFKYLGEMKVFKRKLVTLPHHNKNRYWHGFKTPENAVHEYQYIVRINYNILYERGSKYLSTALMGLYIRDRSIANNLDLPLYNSNEYSKVNKHKKRSTEHV